MKTTIVPAQVTSKEDTIAANLSLTQLGLLIMPVFLMALIFALIPPFMHIVIFKLVIIIFLSLPCLLLAVRLNGTLVIKWLQLAQSYKNRPSKYLLTLRESNCRFCDSDLLVEAIEPNTAAEPLEKNIVERLNPREIDLIKHDLIGKKINYYINKEGVVNASFEESK